GGAGTLGTRTCDEKVACQNVAGNFGRQLGGTLFRTGAGQELKAHPPLRPAPPGRYAWGMTTTPDTTFPDVMLVCRTGHVLTDRLHGSPESAAPRCDRCGAATLDRCPTCGLALPGAAPVPGLHPIGHPRPPAFCCRCGAAFPWTRRPAA